MEAKAKINLLDLHRPDMEAFFTALGEKAFRASQVLQWLHQQGVADIDAMTNLSKALRERIKEIAEIRVPEVVSDQRSVDGTRKWLLRLDDGNCVETVFIPEEGRGTLCVSSQVGCALNCAFCHTARQGFNRNLSVGEIIAQLGVANRALGAAPNGERVITNVVFMGMGEPLLNFDNVVKAMGLMLDDFAYGLSKRRVTLSTAGVVPALERLREVCDVSLAVSLHAPNDELRSQLVPLNKKYPIAQLLAACRRYVAGEPRRKITMEYVMLAGVNDAPAQARELVKLLAGVPVKVNLIPFNSFAHSGYVASSPEAVDGFREILMKAGVITIRRRVRGDDIDAACGQLAGKVKDRGSRTLRRAAGQ